MDRLAGKLCSKAAFFQSANTVSDDEKLLLGIYQEAVLVLLAPTLMGHTRHLELTRQHQGLKRVIRRRRTRAVSGMWISWQSAHARRPLKSLIPAQPKGIAPMLVSIPAGRNAVTGEP